MNLKDDRPKTDYANKETMLQDAEWFEAHAASLELKAARFRRLAAAIRASQS